MSNFFAPAAGGFGGGGLFSQQQPVQGNLFAQPPPAGQGFFGGAAPAAAGGGLFPSAAPAAAGGFFPGGLNVGQATMQRPDGPPGEADKHVYDFLVLAKNAGGPRDSRDVIFDDLEREVRRLLRIQCSTSGPMAPVNIQGRKWDPVDVNNPDYWKLYWEKHVWPWSPEYRFYAPFRNFYEPNVTNVSLVPVARSAGPPAQNEHFQRFQAVTKDEWERYYENDVSPEYHVGSKFRVMPCGIFGFQELYDRLLKQNDALAHFKAAAEKLQPAIDVAKEKQRTALLRLKAERERQVLLLDRLLKLGARVAAAIAGSTRQPETTLENELRARLVALRDDLFLRQNLEARLRDIWEKNLMRVELQNLTEMDTGDAALPAASGAGGANADKAQPESHRQLMQAALMLREESRKLREGIDIIKGDVAVAERELAYARGRDFRRSASAQVDRSFNTLLAGEHLDET